MRSLYSRLVVPALLTVSAIVAPVTTHASTPQTATRAVEPVAGIYRLILTGKNRVTKTIHLVIQETSQGLDGVLLAERSDSRLIAVHQEGNQLRATLMTNEGVGELVLEMRLADDVTGTLTVGSRQMTIRGERSA